MTRDDAYVMFLLAVGQAWLIAACFQHGKRQAAMATAGLFLIVVAAIGVLVIGVTG